MKAIHLAILLLVGSLTLLNGCNESGESQIRQATFCSSMADRIGKSCTVQFRRDTLGCNTTLPVPPTTDSINGAQVSINGKLVMTGDNWIAIERTGTGTEVRIPEAVILLVSIQQ